MPYLFTQELVDSFPSKVKDKFNGYNLIFGQDVLAFNEDSLRLRGRVIKKKKQNNELFLKNIVKTCVGKNGLGVNELYAVNAIKLAIKKAEFIGTNMQDAAGRMRKHDILFITKKTYNKTGEISKDNIMIEEILGFILTQFGECSLLPTVPALQIICSGNSQVSKYLMYTYIKSVKRLGLNTGVLELANGYENVGGLCLYNKFGFREDSILDHRLCFNEGAKGFTLAMRADFTDAGYGDLDDVVLGRKDKIDLKNQMTISEPMCNKSNDVGKAYSNAQIKYIDQRIKNRNYLTNLFAIDDENTIKELLDATDIDRDVLKGDGTTDTNYALKELIEKGKMLAINSKRELSDLINKKSLSSNNTSSSNYNTSSSNYNTSSSNNPNDNYAYNIKRRRSANNTSDGIKKRKNLKAKHTKKRRHAINAKKRSKSKKNTR
jgi:hypothetical protein